MNFDFRKFLAEGYDADEKSGVIVDFAKYLETALGLTFEKHESIVKDYCGSLLVTAMANTMTEELQLVQAILV